MIIVALIIAAGPAAAAAEALSPAAQRGLVFTRTHCAQCHAVGKTGDRLPKIAPPFRTLHLRYPVESLAEALAEGIVTGHPTMPEFQLDPSILVTLNALRARRSVGRTPATTSTATSALPEASS